MSTKLDRALSIIITMCALAIAGVTVARQFDLTEPRAIAAAREPAMVEDWQDILVYGSQIGDPDADVQLVEFVDFQCPFCQSFHSDALRPVLEGLDAPIGVVLVHFPLTSHRLARRLAQGAECAKKQEMLRGYADAVFAEPPQSLDTEQWSRLGSDIGVADVERFVHCAEGQDPALQDRVTEGKDRAIEMGVRATPTVLIGGWRLPSPPDHDEIVRVVTALRAGQDPF